MLVTIGLAECSSKASLIVKMGTSAQPIFVYNRYSGKIEQEPIYGERWLRWTYETSAGRFALSANSSSMNAV